MNHSRQENKVKRGISGVSHRSEQRWLIALVVCACLLRLGAILAVGSYRLEHVTYEHGQIAANLVAGNGFSIKWLGGEGPTSMQAPVYPSMLAVNYFIFGPGTQASLLAMQSLQAIVGGILVWLVFQLSLQLVPDKKSVAWFAALSAGLYPTLVYAATQIQVVAVAPCLVTAVLYLAVRSRNAARVDHTSSATKYAVGCGCTGGILVLTDPILGLVTLVSWFVLLDRATRFKRTLLAAATAAIVVTPWSIRNYFVHREFVPVKSTFGYAFWQGNHARSWGTDKIPLPSRDQSLGQVTISIRDLEQSLWKARMIDTLYIDDAVLPNSRIEVLGQLSEPARSRELLHESFAYLREHPSHYIRLTLQRIRFFLLFDPTNPKSVVLPYRISHMTLSLLAVIGFLMSLKYWRQLWPTYVAFGLVTTFHSLTIISARFHIPLEPLMCLWAGWPLGFLLHWGIGMGTKALKLRPSHGTQTIPRLPLLHGPEKI